MQGFGSGREIATGNRDPLRRRPKKNGLPYNGCEAYGLSGEKNSPSTYGNTVLFAPFICPAQSDLGLIACDF